LTQNLLINSKSVENQNKLQLQKLFQITLSFSTNFLGIFLTPNYFFTENSIFGVYFHFGKDLVGGPLVSGRFSSARARLLGHVSHAALFCRGHKREAGHAVLSSLLRFPIPVHLPIAPIPVPTRAPAPSAATASTSDA
jgi:hypothetical protein